MFKRGDRLSESYTKTTLFPLFGPCYTFPVLHLSQEKMSRDLLLLRPPSGHDLLLADKSHCTTLIRHRS